MAMHCSGVLPGAYTASGMPTRRSVMVDLGEARSRNGRCAAAPQRRAARRCRRQLRPAAPAARSSTNSILPDGGRTSMRAWPSTRRSRSSGRSGRSPSRRCSPRRTSPAASWCRCRRSRRCSARSRWSRRSGLRRHRELDRGHREPPQDGLIFTHDLLIQREVVLDVEHCLLGRGPGSTTSRSCSRSRSPLRSAPFPPPTALGSRAARRELDGRSGAHGQRGGRGWLGSDRAAWLASCMGSRCWPTTSPIDGNQARFVVVARDTVPPPTGHDKTSVVVFQRANVPGSLISILQEFAARRVDLSKLESRPTKAGGLGDYCFVIDAEGHIADELVADALRSLHAKQGGEVPRLVPARRARRLGAGTPTPAGVRPTTGCRRCASRSTALPRHAGALRRLGR